MYVLTIFLFLASISDHVTAKNKEQLEGKVVVVTGGAKGIGYAIAENYLKAGVRNVTIVELNQPRGLLAEKILNSLYGNRVLFIHGDVTTDLHRVSNIVYRKFGCIDILVNNAGIVNEYDPVNMILTNLMATMLWSERFYNVMREDRGGKGGTIMNVASVSSVSKDPFYWNYKASKFGVLGFTFGLGHEYNYLTSGVRVFAICPGFTYTDMTSQLVVLDGLKEVVVWQQPDAVGRAAVVLYETAITGEAYTVEGGKIFVTPDRTNLTVEFLKNLY